MSNYGADRGKCPMCGALAVCESVDVGVGLYLHPDGLQCTRCDWEEHGEHQPELTMDERPFAPPEAYLC
jgi:hypothetical protein